MTGLRREVDAARARVLGFAGEDDFSVPYNFF